MEVMSSEVKESACKDELMVIVSDLANVENMVGVGKLMVKLELIGAKIG